MAKLVRVNSISQGWETLVKKIIIEGEDVNDERGSKTREILDIVTEIRDPLNCDPPEGYFWNGEKLEKYSEQFLSDDKMDFVYTYGNRLRKHFNNVDQIKVAIDRMKECKETRRAISITWDQVLDTKNDEVPCMILVDFKIRDGKLRTSALWRSHDIYGAWFANAVALSHLASFVAKEVGVDVGTIIIHSISAHIYEVNFNEAKDKIK
ncbi:MAG: thymidylate synthase [Methanobacteriaceae archaeon]|nr:thymidylate synthase [Methanobacteriaceae archaeon]